ncbi:hypothetical protein ACWGQQ_41100, partial [Bradyrhizobium sp. Lot33]
MARGACGAPQGEIETALAQLRAELLGIEQVGRPDHVFALGGHSLDWFTECGVETVVMESTSVYWIPIFELLDARGFTVFL